MVFISLVKFIIAFTACMSAVVTGKSKKVKTVLFSDVITPACMNPPTEEESREERVGFGDQIAIKLSAYHQDLDESMTESKGKASKIFIVGRHGVPAVNDGVVGMCVGETRRIITAIRKNGPTLAYIVELEAVTGKRLLQQMDADADAALMDRADEL